MNTGLVVADGANWLALADTLGGLPAPFRKDITLIETEVAGTSHIKAITQKTESLKAGDELTLVREPENQFDRMAIRVEMAGGVKIGYVPMEDNEIPANLMDAGKMLVGKVIDCDVQYHYLRIKFKLIMREGAK